MKKSKVKTQSQYHKLMECSPEESNVHCFCQICIFAENHQDPKETLKIESVIDPLDGTL